MANKILTGILAAAAVPIIVASAYAGNALKNLQGPKLPAEVVSGPSIKEVLMQKNKEEKNAKQKALYDFWINLIDFSMNADLYHQINTDVAGNNGVDVMQQVEGTGLKGDVRFKLGKSAGPFKNYFFKFKGKNLDSQGSYNLKERETALIAGREDTSEDTSGTKGSFGIGYWFSDKSVDGKDDSLNLTYSKRTGIEGFILDCDADLGNVLPLKIGLTQKFGNGIRNMRVQMPDYGIDTNESGAAREDVTTISAEGNLGKLTKNKWLQFKINGSLEWKYQQDGNDAYRYTTVRFGPRYSLSTENIVLLAGVEYARNLLTQGPPGADLKSSEEISAGVTLRVYDSVVSTAADWIKNACTSKGDTK